MTTSKPPRLTFWLLQHVLADNEALVGDLLEASGAGRSRTWLWREVLFAILSRSARDGRHERPLGLIRGPLSVAPRSAAVSAWDHPRTINLSGGPVPGIGGLSLVALGALMTIVSPQLWWLAGAGVVAGCLIGLALVLARRRDGLWVPGERRSRLFFDGC